VLYQTTDLLKGKAIIVYDINALKRGKNILQMLLERGQAVDHQLTKEAGKSQVSSLNIQGT
jgi:hypothetical protein